MSNYIHFLGVGHIVYFMKNMILLLVQSRRVGCTQQHNPRPTSIRGGKGSGQRAGEKAFVFLFLCYILHDLIWKYRQFFI